MAGNWLKDYFAKNQEKEWKPSYIDVVSLERNIQSIQRGSDGGSEVERFHQTMALELDKVHAFTRREIGELKTKIKTAGGRNARQVLDAYEKLEKYVNLNYTAMHLLLSTLENYTGQNVQAQYQEKLRAHEWVGQNFPAYIERLYPEECLPSMPAEDVTRDARNPLSVETTHWIQVDDAPRIERLAKLHLKLKDPEHSTGKLSSLKHSPDRVSLVYLDNVQMELYHKWVEGDPRAFLVRLCWYATESPEEVTVELVAQSSAGAQISTLSLSESQVGELLRGALSMEKMAAELRSKGAPYSEQQQVKKLVEQLSRLIETKQLRPSVQIHFSRREYENDLAGLAVLSDISFLKVDGVNLVADPSLGWYKKQQQIPSSFKPSPPSSNSATRGSFTATLGSSSKREVEDPDMLLLPHGVLVVSIKNPMVNETPEWLQSLLRSERISQVNGWNVFQHAVFAFHGDEGISRPAWTMGLKGRRTAKGYVESWYKTGKTLSRKLKQGIASLRRASIHSITPPPAVQSSSKFNPAESRLKYKEIQLYQASL